MSDLVCQNCKSIAVEYEDYVGGTSYYRCKTCGMRGNEDKFTQVTLFSRITASPEVLAESVVYTYEMAIGGSMFRVYWTSPFVENFYPDKPEAIAATVAKLKEVAE
jgi:hypothetical protein